MFACFLQWLQYNHMNVKQLLYLLETLISAHHRELLQSASPINIHGLKVANV